MGSLVIVSNRLPVSVKRVDGRLEFFPSVGGLATGLAPYTKDPHNKWIGWPGLPSDELSEAERLEIASELQKSNCYPVFLTHKQLDDFYNGYSNSVLWPVFHDQELGKAAQGAGEEARLWRAYRNVNALFAEATQALSDVGDTVWVHDYQLMVLPALLRLQRPYDKIGFFLHIPFPSLAQLNKVSSAEALVAGMLGANLVGLHIESYVDNFLDAVRHYELGIKSHHKVMLRDRVVRVVDFPIGIDYEKYEKARKSRAVSREYTNLRLQYAGLKVILTVDRLDPAKGLVERVQAYRTLLRENPGLHGKVVMVMLVVPSRTDVAEYRELKQLLERLVRQTNAEFELLPWKPIEYLYTSLPFEQVTALYRRADVAFIAPLRDGMNLVAKEYLASKPRQHGVLVLSLGAGAAQELKGAIMVDPDSTASLVDGLEQALSMSRRERKRRGRSMQQELSRSNIHVWAKNFTRVLGQDMGLPANRPHTINQTVAADILDAYNNATKRLLLIDYDGVLVPFASRPREAKPTLAILELLQHLDKRPKNTVVVISGRSRHDLDEWFEHGSFEKVAEHGAFTKSQGAKVWHETPSPVAQDWQIKVLPVLERYASKTPGAFVEEKATTLVWHYRKASPYYAQKYLLTLKRVLRPLARQYGLDIQQGNKILEIRPYGITKGTSALAWLERTRADFVLCIGDDYTDEDMFKDLPHDAYTIKVGRGRTAARYRLKNVHSTLKFLQSLV